ncbi:MAG: hypothetical protein VX938_07700, partial [Myxococcota bacterium]|nr:hypothetical protein [Myxococcota bacterium]
DQPYCDGDVLRTCNAYGSGPAGDFENCALQPQEHCIPDLTPDGGPGCACVPACEGKACNADDGCGGTCASLLCGETQCWPEVLDLAGGGNGCFDAAGACGLNDIVCGSLTALDAEIATDCGELGKVCDQGWACDDSHTCECVPDCEGKACGQDHCGTNCGPNDGECVGSQEVCNDAGQCECVPQCLGKTCEEDDGCGAPCAPLLCGDELCWPEVLEMAGGGTGCFDASGVCALSAIGCGSVTALGADTPTDCGDFGKACEDGWTCAESHTCECVPACEGRSCGQDHCGNACGLNGGDCPGPQDVCTDDGQCECVPQCLGKMCNEGDGCGQACAALLCGEDLCWPDVLQMAGAGFGCMTADEACALSDVACGELTALGAEAATDCEATGKVCDEGWACGENNACDCVPDCGDKVCGTDHCGTLCGDNGGECPGEQEVCSEEGQCECVPDCGPLECSSDDGCGGTCTNCQEPDVVLCTGAADESTPLGGACCTTSAEHPTNPSCAGGECLDKQCASGALCNLVGNGTGYCSASCWVTYSWDLANNETGAYGADGVMDPGSMSDQEVISAEYPYYYNVCTAFSDGPYG